MANNEGIPLHGDRAAWNAKDYPREHASDLDDESYQHHLPAPDTSGEVVVDDGTNWIKRVLDPSDLSDPFTFVNAPSTLAIVSGAVTATQSLHIITAESGTEDDLDTINGLTNYQLLLVKADTDNTITLKHLTGNIYFPIEEDIQITGSTWILFFYDGTYAIGIGTGGAGSSFVSLTDTPDDYLGDADKYVRVSSTEDGLVFTDPEGWPDFISKDIDGLSVYSDSTQSERVAVVGRSDEYDTLLSDPLNTGTLSSVEYNQFSEALTLSQTGPENTQTHAVSGASESYSTGSDVPFNTYYYSQRFQYLLLASELEAMGFSAGMDIVDIRLKCYEPPARDLEDVYIRMQNTASTTSTEWVTDGWTTVYGPTTIPLGTVVDESWFEFQLSTPFTWDGNNLLIDFSRIGTDYVSGGGNYTLSPVSDRAFAWYDDVSTGWPYDDNSGSTYTYILETQLTVLEYTSEGTRVLPSMSLGTGENPGWEIVWASTEPTNTSITVETAVTTGATPAEAEWAEQTSGTAISNIPSGDLTGYYLWVRQTLATTSGTATPSLSSMTVYYDNADYGLVDLRDRTANTFLAGPISGAATRPDYRAITNDDIPDTVEVNALRLIDGVLEPATVPGTAVLYVDQADGELKIKFSDDRISILSISHETVNKGINANGVILESISKGITSDSVIETIGTGSVTSDAFVDTTKTGSVTSDAAIQGAASNSVTADAAIGSGETGILTADGHIVLAQASSVTADADIESGGSSSVTADASISSP